eukprot:TRINITY_DN3410_c0_g1_i1.p1 TRINITY_DN3410_c0_g1~~TRINITY_DN3410_c0_g1_i1.p1  ORF type:complete len:385 (+),score=119.31 TRINITY_DN3410_c0_g1_i1:65-1219(+)
MPSALPQGRLRPAAAASFSESSGSLHSPVYPHPPRRKVAGAGDSVCLLPGLSADMVPGCLLPGEEGVVVVDHSERNRYAVRGPRGDFSWYDGGEIVPAPTHTQRPPSGCATPTENGRHRQSSTALVVHSTAAEPSAGERRISEFLAELKEEVLEEVFRELRLQRGGSDSAASPQPARLENGGGAQSPPSAPPTPPPLPTAEDVAPAAAAAAAAAVLCAAALGERSVDALAAVAAAGAAAAAAAAGSAFRPPELASAAVAVAGAVAALSVRVEPWSLRFRDEDGADFHLACAASVEGRALTLALSGEPAVVVRKADGLRYSAQTGKLLTASCTIPLRPQEPFLAALKALCADCGVPCVVDVDPAPPAAPAPPPKQKRGWFGGVIR